MATHGGSSSTIRRQVRFDGRARVMRPQFIHRRLFQAKFSGSDNGCYVNQNQADAGKGPGNPASALLAVCGFAGTKPLRQSGPRRWRCKHRLWRPRRCNIKRAASSAASCARPRRVTARRPPDACWPLDNRWWRDDRATHAGRSTNRALARKHGRCRRQSRSCRLARTTTATGGWTASRASAFGVRRGSPSVEAWRRFPCGSRHARAGSGRQHS